MNESCLQARPRLSLPRRSHVAHINELCHTFECVIFTGTTPLVFATSESHMQTAEVMPCCSVLQCVAVCYSVLQCVAVCCSVLQSRLQAQAMPCCSVLQCVAVCCSVLQCVAVCCTYSPQYFSYEVQYVAVCCSVLQYVAVCCSVVQDVV